MYVGRQAGSDASFVYDPWQQYRDGVVTNPNMLLAGVIGRGKSALAKSLALRMTAFGVRVYVPGDPKGEWGAGRPSGRRRADRARSRAAGTHQPARPRAAARAIGEEDWRREVEARRLNLLAALAETALDRKLAPVERTRSRPRRSRTPASAAKRPLLPEVVAALMAPSSRERPLGQHERAAR